MASALSFSLWLSGYLATSPERSINDVFPSVRPNISCSAATFSISSVPSKHTRLCTYGGTMLLNSYSGVKLWMPENVNSRFPGRVWSMCHSGTTPFQEAGSSSPVASIISTLTEATQFGRSPAISIVVIGATGVLAMRKIFPALFALYDSGQLPKNFAIFGYSRKDITDEGLREMIATTLTCRISEKQNCEDKREAFLKRIHCLNGGLNNREGTLRLQILMEYVEGNFETNRIFYLSVPQEALSDIASSIAENSQTNKGWNRIIIEKPFGSNSLSSHHLTSSLLSDFEEKQLYRIDHLLGRNTIENLTVLRFSNLVFMPLWNRNYIQSVQIIFCEETGMHTPAG
ncbi:unnamed protein product [Cuscuta europaea]|uniref:Glucose-6-phosphate dehydrogenase (NADP(+)) n=1 Tax=Cuscuta europaea TaxID=41803 RepID=A0A9P0YTE6_CUSEU|nr:unnamed protein product [Cuscuta europaea]